MTVQKRIVLFSVIAPSSSSFLLFILLYKSFMEQLKKEDMSTLRNDFMTSNSAAGRPMKVTVLFRHADSKEPGSSSKNDKVWMYLQTANIYFYTAFSLFFCWMSHQYIFIYISNLGKQHQHWWWCSTMWNGDSLSSARIGKFHQSLIHTRLPGIPLQTTSYL